MCGRLLIAVLCVSFLLRSEAIKAKARIVEGKTAKHGQFPWHVLLKKNATSKTICGGSLISTEWVLTAANCLKNAESVFVMLGTAALYNPEALNMTSTFLYRHPSYEVALIKLPNPVNLTSEIQATPIPPETFEYQNYPKNAVISGFGALGDKWILEETHNLKYIAVNLIDLYSCDKWDEDEFICAESAKPSGSICDGDLGGAMIGKDKTGRPMQIGIITEIPKFCDWPTPVVYFQVKKVAKWISILTKIDFDEIGLSYM